MSLEKFLQLLERGGADLQNRKHLNGETATPAAAPLLNNATSHNWGNGIVNPSDISNPRARRWSGSTAMSNDLGGDQFTDSHVPHPICKHERTGSDSNC